VAQFDTRANDEVIGENVDVDVDVDVVVVVDEDEDGAVDYSHELTINPLNHLLTP